MEYCIEARALKSSFLSELAMMKKSTQPVFFDELLCVNGINGVSCDDFSVDVFLDLSNEEELLLKDEFVEEGSEEEEEKDSLSVSSQNNRVEDGTFNSTTNVSGIIDSASFPAGELSVPVEDLEHLEWLSQFVEDPVSEFSFLCPNGNFKENIGNRSEQVSRPVMIQRSPVFCFASPVPAKARSKRSRPSGQAWSRASSSLSESSSTTFSSCRSSPTSATVFSNLIPATDLIFEPPVKKQKKRELTEESGGDTGGGGYQTQRQCSHCQVQKTPQWRTGPLGAKTLCNACGVRYKSGRLFPEYRPACSPTFSGDVHSNSHRKVLEMRRQKEDAPGVEAGLSWVISSC